MVGTGGGAVGVLPGGDGTALADNADGGLLVVVGVEVPPGPVLVGVGVHGCRLATHRARMPARRVMPAAAAMSASDPVAGSPEVADGGVLDDAVGVGGVVLGELSEEVAVGSGQLLHGGISSTVRIVVAGELGVDGGTDVLEDGALVVGADDDGGDVDGAVGIDDDDVGARVDVVELELDGGASVVGGAPHCGNQLSGQVQAYTTS